MPAQIFGTDAVVTMLNRAFNDISPSNATFKNQVAAAGTTTESQTAFAKTFGAGYAGMTADALSTLLLGNIGVLPNAGLQTALKDYITSAGVANVGIVALQLGQILSGLENATGEQAAFKAAALAWNNEVTAAYNYSSNPANTTPSDQGSTVTPGTTFSLTAGADVFSPSAADPVKKSTAGNDTFRGDLAAGDLSTTDVIDGGAGTDTLNALLGASAKPVLSNVELINVTTTGAAATLELGDATGVTNVVHKAIAAGTGLTVNDVALTTTVGLTGTFIAADVSTFTFKGATGTNDTANLSLAEAVTALAAPVKILAIENLNINVSDIAATTGNVSTINSLVVTDTKSITVAGTVGTLTLGGDATGVSDFKALTKFDASGLTGNLVLDLATGAGTQVDPTGGVTVTGSKGVNTITFGATAGQTDTLKFVTGNVSTIAKLTTVTNFDFAVDKLDLSAFALGADTTATATTVAAAGDIAGFFSGTGRIVINDNTDTVYVDVNKDGNFNAGTDLAVVLTGMNNTAAATTFSLADVVLA
ncbi:MAG: hypothetical protein V4679_06325 [Pseudomonadota bacterium]